MTKKQFIGVLLILGVVPFFSIVASLTMNWQLKNVNEQLLVLEEQLRIVTEYKRDILQLESQVETLHIDLEVCQRVKRFLGKEIQEYSH